MPFIGALGIFSKLVAYFLGDEAPIAANERSVSDAVSSLMSIIGDLEKKIKAAKEVIAESECENFKICSEIEARIGELKKELALIEEDHDHINSSECKIPEIISEIETFINELEKQLMEEEEDE